MTQQVQKGQMRAGAGPGKLGIPAGGSSLCSGSSSSLDRTHSTDSKHQLGADLSSKQSCPSPEPGEAGDNTRRSLLCPNLHRRQSCEPSGLGEEPAPLLHVLGHPWEQSQFHPAASKWGLGSAVPQEHLHTSQHSQAPPKDPILSFLPLSSCITLWLTPGYFGFLCILLAVPWTAVQWGLDLVIQNCFRGKNQAEFLCWVQLSSSTFSSKLCDSS